MDSIGFSMYLVESSCGCIRDWEFPFSHVIDIWDRVSFLKGLFLHEQLLKSSPLTISYSPSYAFLDMHPVTLSLSLATFSLVCLFSHMPTWNIVYSL